MRLYTVAIANIVTISVKENDGPMNNSFLSGRPRDFAGTRRLNHRKLLSHTDVLIVITKLLTMTNKAIGPMTALWPHLIGRESRQSVKQSKDFPSPSHQ